jgi:chemotaxis protein CheD
MAKHIIGVADMQISDAGGDIMVTHALGSCLGVAVHDRSSGIGGMLHVMMPSSRISPAKAEANPFMFVDTGVPVLLREMFAAGAVKSQLEISVAGGAAKQTEDTDYFAIGKHNYIMLRKLLWQYDLLLKGEDVGGELPRTMYLEVGSGRVWLNSMGQDKYL